MSRILLSLLLSLMFFQFGFSQNDGSIDPETRSLIKAEIEQYETDKESRIKNFIKDNPQYSLGTFKLEGKKVMIEDVINGRPIFKASHNRGAGQTTNADELHPGGGAGLELDGTGIRLGVWEIGTPRTSHQELVGRAILMDPADVEFHATHVTGTIIASGVQANAKGMAPAATINCYDAAADGSEMNNEGNAGMILSNHSYGIFAGWNDTGETWYGDPNISEDEDWKYGFYDSQSRNWDNISFSNPNYLIVTSAGNHRGNNGIGHPANGPYDIIPFYSGAKNIMTVGAVRKTTNYNDPSDVVMSSFSSWGPMDDGRIKPDIVGAGVGVVSSGASSDDDYRSSQGTSMASPNVMGSLALVQQAHQQFKGSVMRSATLKALSFHTAEESGPGPGPDYMFGWGLLNARKMVDKIIAEDGVNEVIIEDQLSNGETFEIELNPVPGEKITATLVWTDPPGLVSGPSLDNPALKLINDLDMVIENENGDKEFPWILDPANPGDPATRGDNFRDNAEQIQFLNPEPRKYFLKINHKGNLQNGFQNFSLIISYKSETSGLTNLYYTGRNGNWSDMNNWSFSSGGPSAGIIPTSENKVIFDNNSFGGNGETSQLDGDFEVGGVSWFATHNSAIDLGGFSLTIGGNVLMDSEDLIIQNGKMILSSDSDRDFVANLKSLTTSNLELEIGETNTANWSIHDTEFSAKSLYILGGALVMENVTLNGLENFDAFGGSDFTTNNTVFNFADGSNSNIATGQISLNSVFNLNASNATVDVAGTHFDYISSNGGSVLFTGPISIGTFILDGVTSTHLETGTTVTITEDMMINNGGMEVTIDNNGGTENATLNFDVHKKLCFDNLLINNVDIQGQSSVNAGQNSQVNNAANWLQMSCENLLFADFFVEGLCAYDFSKIIDNSSGDVAIRKWYVDDVLVAENVESFGYNFMGEGLFFVKLEIESSGGDNLIYEGEIELIPNSLEENTIIENTTQLISKESAIAYQWYRNEAILDGETERIHTHNDVPGNYFVITFDDLCSRQSEVNSFMTAVDEVFSNGSLSIYPNPMNDFISVEFNDIDVSDLGVEIYDLLGRPYYRKLLNGNSQNRLNIDTAEFPAGIYLIKIQKDGDVFSEILVKQ